MCYWFLHVFVCYQILPLFRISLCLLQAILFWTILLLTVINDKEIEFIEVLLGKMILADWISGQCYYFWKPQFSDLPGFTFLCLSREGLLLTNCNSFSKHLLFPFKVSLWSLWNSQISSVRQEEQQLHQLNVITHVICMGLG